MGVFFQLWAILVIKCIFFPPWMRLPPAVIQHLNSITAQSLKRNSVCWKACTNPGLRVNINLYHVQLILRVLLHVKYFICKIMHVIFSCMVYIFLLICCCLESQICHLWHLKMGARNSKCLALNLMYLNQSLYTRHTTPKACVSFHCWRRINKILKKEPFLKGTLKLLLLY